MRTPAQRRHDAFREILERAASYDPNTGRRATPSFLALVDYQQLVTATGIATPEGPPLSGAAANHLDNGLPLCHHHRYVHEGGGSIQRDHDHTHTFHRPDGSRIEEGWKALAGRTSAGSGGLS